MATVLEPIDTRRAPARTERSLCRQLDELWDEGKIHRERVNPTKTRDRDRKLYRGEVGPKGQNPRYKLNFIQAFVDRQIAQLTQSRPINRIGARKEKLRGVARVLTQLSEHAWDSFDVQRQTVIMATHAALDGAAGLLTVYNATTHDLDLRLLTIGDLVVDPAVRVAARVCSDAEYVGWCSIMTLSEIRDLFPARGRLVLADQRLNDLSTGRDMSSGGATTPKWIVKESQDSEGPMPRAEVRYMMVKDRQKDPGGRRLFPTGRHIIYTKDVVLWDGPNPYWDGEWPVDLFEWAPDPDHVFGHSGVELLRESQLAFNALMDGTVTTRIDTNFMSVVGDWNALSEDGWRKLAAMEGTNVVKRMVRGAAIDIVPPSPVSQDAVALAKSIFTYAQIITGCTDAMLGENPGSLQSGSAIEGLQESASLMTAARQSRMEDFYARVGQKLISRQVQSMDSDRVVALIGEQEGDAKAYADFRTGFTLDENGRGVTTEQRMQALRDFKFGVVPGSSGPMAKQNRAMMAKELQAAGLMPGWMVLEMAGFPNPRELAAEGAKEMQAMATTMQAMKSM